MALVRLALKKHLQPRGLPPVSHSAASLKIPGRQVKTSGHEIVKSFATDAGDKAIHETTSDGKDVTISEDKKSNWFPSWNRSKGLWRNKDGHFVPAPFGLGHALMQATGNLNRLFENLKMSPWSVFGRVKEQEDCYKLRFDMPGLTKEDVKISVLDGVLRIKGEHNEEEGEETDDEFWSSRSYGAYYDTSLMLPDDAKIDDIKAALKDGVLSVIIPRTERPKQDVKEVNVE